IGMGIHERLKDVPRAPDVQVDLLLVFAMGGNQKGSHDCFTKRAQWSSLDPVDLPQLPDERSGLERNSADLAVGGYALDPLTVTHGLGPIKHETSHNHKGPETHEESRGLQVLDPDRTSRPSLAE